MKILLSIGLTFAILSVFLFYAPHDKQRNEKNFVTENAAIKLASREKKVSDNIVAHAKAIRPYILKNHYNSNICFLIDMSVPSGKNRFFIYDLERDTILQSALVCHGSGSQTNTDKLIFSNEPGSLATALGRYKIGNSYNGSFGLAYKLFGLDTTNDNAYQRAIVLHAHKLVPHDEVYPGHVCLSWGCPTVNPIFLQTLSGYIDNAKKPIILWIYYNEQ